MGVDERLSLEAVSEHSLIAVEHRHRYAFAAPACAGKRVVDLCCGVGYGSELLAEVAADVVGVDRDAAAIDSAQAGVGQRSSARFVADDALGYLRRLEPADVDVIVCFEGLEHVPDVEAVADQLGRLAAGGVGLVASVPNSATFGEVNEYHLTDFDRASAEALAARIPGAVLAFQSHAEGSIIQRDAGGTVRVEVQVDGEQDLDWANHFLLLAGVDVDALLGSASSLVHVAVAPVNHRYMRNLELAHRSLLATNARLTRERLGLGAAGAASAVIRRGDGGGAPGAGSGRDAAWTQTRVAELEAEVIALRAERDALVVERDGYRRAWVAVRSSRLTNLAARVAGHRFERT